MNLNDKRVAAGGAAALLVASAAGFGVARWIATPITPKNTTAPAEAEAPADTVAMGPAAIQRAGILFEKVGAGGFGAEISAQGTVTASPTGEAMVTARASGAVVRVLKRLGDPVRAGEALAIVESRDAAQFTSDVSVASARLALANKNLARERYLFQQKVSARVDLDRAEAEAATARAELRRAQAAVGAAKVSPDGRGVLVVSPISGRVTAQAVSLGGFVQPETELFRVADPSQIQIEAAVGPEDAKRLAPGNRAVVELPDGSTIDARVHAVTPALNAETRTATAVLDMDGRLQPGLAVRVRLIPSRGEIGKSIIVPEDAVQIVDGRDKVFIRTAQGFRAVPVTVGRRSAGRAELIDGIQPGQIIATRNAFLLKAELGKGASEER